MYDQTTKLIERVSVSDTGVQANGDSFSPSLSANGRYVTFASRASNLVPGDTNEFADIFVYDRTTKLIERVSVNEIGDQADRASDSPALSADGRFVTFGSTATNLVAGAINLGTQIYVYDRNTKLIERVSVNNGGEFGNGFSNHPSMSADGRYVTFRSDARNFLPGNFNGPSLNNIFVYDRTTKLIEQVNISDAGVQGNGESQNPSLSADGRFVTFASAASNLVSGDTNGSYDMFVYDRTTKLIERISLSDAGLQGNSYSGNIYSGNTFSQNFGQVPPLLSSDGRYVTFASNASNLVPGDTNQTGDIFVYDRTTKLIERVSISDAGVQGIGESFYPSLSADGRYVSFASSASNLVPGGDNGTSNVFVYDRTTKLIQAITYRPITSVIDVISSTIAFTSNSAVNSAVYGHVKANNSLFVSNEVALDLASRLSPIDSYSNIFSDTPQSNLVSSLQRSGTLPPVHHLFNGNPAINAADSARNGTRDQQGSLRVLADIGSVEATSGTVSGKVYVDANRNGRFDTGEPGIPGVIVNISGTEDLVTSTQSDNSQTLLVNESGLLDGMQLAVGIYKFDTQVIPGWSTYTPPLEIVRNQSLSGNSNSNYPSLSADGRYLAFHSRANNLVPEDTNGSTDIFVFDRITKLIERVSVSDTGVQGDSDSNRPSLSADGRYVTFISIASNLVPGDTDDWFDIFVFDRTTKLVERIPADISYPSLSGNGRFVSFSSSETDLVPGDTNQTGDIFVYDGTTKLIERVSVNDAGVQGNDEVGEFSSMSADGRYVTFSSYSSNLVTGDTEIDSDIFVYDRITKLIEQISVNDVGVQAESERPSLSANGRYVTFQSTVNTLVPDDTNGQQDIFVYDRTTKLVERVSVSDAGVQANSTSDIPSLSADGRYVTFASIANNLVPGDTNGQKDIFVYDRTTKLIKRVSVSDAGVQGNSRSDIPSLSADGRYVSFESDASNLATGENNARTDIFIVPNPFADSGVSLNLQAGDVYTDLNLGLVPNPGTINGRAFEDTIANGVFDVGEPAIANAVVFLDLDGDGLRDAGEASVTTNADGTYQFLNIDS